MLDSEDPGGRKDSHLNGASDYDSTGEATGVTEPKETSFTDVCVFAQPEDQVHRNTKH